MLRERWSELLGELAMALCAAAGETGLFADRKPKGENMETSNGRALFRAAVVLACGALGAACSQAPSEPAPVFTLPISRVTPAPPGQGEATTTASAPSQLRYVAVPAGQHVPGMAHARIVVKQKKGTRHRQHHAQKKAVARPVSIKKPTEAAEPGTKP